MSANPNAIVTLGIVKSYLKITQVDFTVDEFIQDWINATSDMIEDHIHGPVKLKTYASEIYDGNNEGTLYLHHAPIYSLANGAVSDLQYRVAPTDGWLDLLDDVNNILIDPNAPYMVKLYGAKFPKGRQNIKLSTKAGYQILTSAISEVGGVGNGVLTAFSFATKRSPILSTVTVTLNTILNGNTAVEASDDHSGHITGTSGTTGVMNYNSGIISLNFTTPVVSGQPIYVSYSYYTVPGIFIRVITEMVAELYKESGYGSARLGQSSRSLANSAGSDVFYMLFDKHKAMLEPYIRQHA